MHDNNVYFYVIISFLHINEYLSQSTDRTLAFQQLEIAPTILSTKISLTVYRYTSY